MKKFEHTLRTAGDGYWSNHAKDVRTIKMNLAYMNEEEDFAELRVYFDTETWNVETDGLIYTDSKFLASLQKALNEEDFAGSNVSYSEQGMQGDNYVSLDVGKKFITSWVLK